MDHWCAFSLNGKILNFSDGDLTPPAVVTRPGIEQFFFLFSFLSKGPVVFFVCGASLN